MASASQLLANLGFPKAHPVAERSSIVDLFRKRRCGIYALEFANGEAYVGKSRDVTRRFLQHKATYPDLIALWFRTLPKEELDEREQAAIRSLEASGLKLRNIAYSSLPRLKSDLDAVASREEQERWLDAPLAESLGGERTNDPDLRRKLAGRLPRLLELPDAELAISLLRTFARRCLFAPLRTELAFWSVTCLPKTGMVGERTYSRVNVNWQEVFSIEEAEGQIWWSWRLARTPLVARHGPGLRSLLERFPGLEMTEHRYKAGGHDQLHLYTWDKEVAAAVLEDEELVRAMRRYNLTLMQKGPCAWSAYHCFALADRLLAASPPGDGAEARGRLMGHPSVRSPAVGSSAPRKAKASATSLDPAFEKTMSEHLPRGRGRAPAVAFFAETIAMAHRENPSRWGVGFSRRGLLLQVGAIGVMEMLPAEVPTGEVRFVVDGTDLPEEFQELRLWGKPDLHLQFRVSGAIWMSMFPEDCGTISVDLIARFHRLICRAAKTPFPKWAREWHTQRAVTFLARLTRSSLPRPSYVASGAPGVGALDG